MLASLADHGGVEWVLERVANGEPLRQIAADLGCTRAVLSDWMLIDPERRALYLSARAASAAAMAEHSLQIADATSEVGTSKARLQIETRQWLAGVYDREQYGAKPTGVNINIGMLHLDSLRRANEREQSNVQVIDTKALPE